MKAAKLVGKCRHEFIEVDIPEIDPFEVLVKVELCGLCASELEKWKSGVLQGFTYMGHEIVGTVEKIGEYVNNVQVGDRVTGYICNGFAEYAKAHHSLVLKVPDSLKSKDAMGEPLGCLVSGLRQTKVELGDRVCVIGLGYMGLGFLSLMKNAGASEIVAVDLREESLEYAKKLGATKTLFPQEVDDNYKVIEYGTNMDGGFDVVVEASGSQPALTLANQLVGLHKKLSVVGFHQGGTRTVDVELQNWKAVQIINAHERRDHFMMDSIRRGLAMIEAKRIDMGQLVTHSYDFQDLDQGFQDFLDKKDNYIKGMIQIGK